MRMDVMKVLAQSINISAVEVNSNARSASRNNSNNDSCAMIGKREGADTRILFHLTRHTFTIGQSHPPPPPRTIKLQTKIYTQYQGVSRYHSASCIRWSSASSICGLDHKCGT